MSLLRTSYRSNMETATRTSIKSAILFQNLEKTITLLDLPVSLSLAQGTSTSPNTSIIYSSTALQSPYPSTEPKSDRARASITRKLGTKNAHEFPGFLLSDALECIETHHKGEWSLQRQISPVMLASRRKRKRDDHKEQSARCEVISDAVEPRISVPAYKYEPKAKAQWSPTIHRSIVNDFPDMQSITHQLVHNPHDMQLPLTIISTGQTYIIPPGAAFYLGNIDTASAQEFSAIAQSFYRNPSATAGPGQFDLILLDPPWDNRSVKRSGNYRTMRQDWDPFTVLQGKLGRHIAPKGLVACWITNGTKAQNSVMKAFKTWGVGLVEEWAWLKTTVKGLPVTDVEGIWRKPYEILLVGRRMDGSNDRGSFPESEVQRRVIVAVPDFHSRKPSLKELFTPMMVDPESYRALEVFARSLTAGWLSWGDEVVKFNWEGHWPRNCRYV